MLEVDDHIFMSNREIFRIVFSISVVDKRSGEIFFSKYFVHHTANIWELYVVGANYNHPVFPQKISGYFESGINHVEPIRVKAA